MKQRSIILIVVGLAVVIGGIIVLNYFTSTKLYTVNYEHVSKVEVVQIGDAGSDVIATIQRSGDTVRVANDGDYVVKYTGTEGYADGTRVIEKDTTISIDPDFSSQKYAELVAREFPAVRQAISERYPQVNDLFLIEEGAMYQEGVWFTAWLSYRGEYSQNSDNLRVLLKFEDNHWALMTQPDIIVTSINYPRIPLDVLSWANSAF